MNIYDIEGEYKNRLEQHVIGALLIEPRMVKDVMGFLTASDFSYKSCAAVYAFALDKYTKGEAFDPVIAMESVAGLEADPQKFLADCMTITGGTWVNGTKHAELLHQAADDIRLYHSVQQALDNCDGKELPAELMRIAQDANKGRLGKRRSMQELVSQLFEGFDKGPSKRLDTGFKRLDGLLMGFRPGNLIILAARPGVGKSAFAMQMAENMAKAGKKVLVYSLEMSGDELSERWMAKTSGVQMDHIIQHEFDDKDWPRMSEAAQYLYTLPIIVNDESNVSPAKVRTEALEISDLECIIVDYVGLMESDGGKRAKENRNLELGSISRDLKKLAAELEIPIVMLCQLNREIDDETQPELRHLRDSGELEQNANKILFIWNIDKEEETVGVSVAKNRQGKKGVVQMFFQSDYMRFVERERDHELPTVSKSKRKGAGFYDD